MVVCFGIRTGIHMGKREGKKEKYIIVLCSHWLMTKGPKELCDGWSGQLDEI